MEDPLFVDPIVRGAFELDLRLMVGFLESFLV